MFLKSSDQFLRIISFSSPLHMMHALISILKPYPVIYFHFMTTRPVMSGRQIL